MMNEGGVLRVGVPLVVGCVLWTLGLGFCGGCHFCPFFPLLHVLRYGVSGALSLT